MKTLKMIFVLVFCFGLVQVSFGQPDTLWTKNLDGRAYFTNDDGIICSNWTTITCLDHNLDTLWHNKDELPSGYVHIAQLKNNAVIAQFAGRWTEAGFVMFDESGDSLLTKKLNYGGHHFALEDGKFIFSDYGKHNSGGIICFDENIDTVWIKQPSEIHGVPISFTETQNGIFTIDCHRVDENCLIRFNADGDTLWTFKHNLYSERWEDLGLRLMVNSTDNGVIFVHSDTSIRKLDANGVKLWQRDYPDKLGDYYKSICATHDNGFVIVGSKQIVNTVEHKATMYKFDSKGTIIWEMNWDLKSHTSFDIKETSDHGYILINYSSDASPLIIRFKPDVTDLDLKSNVSLSNYTLSQNYPNPFNPSTSIEFTLPRSEYSTLKVYNILGAEVATLVSDKLQAGRHTFQFDGSKLASGVYYYQVSAGEFKDVRKMILLR